MNTIRVAALAGIALALGVVLVTSPATAHCDAMDGPVVKAARSALASGNVHLVLPWVESEDEPEIRAAFDRTLAVRTLGSEAQELADQWFFETLVRVHRAGEGAPFTGVKPAGGDLGPAIPVADEALVTGNVDPLVNLITAEARAGIVERFEHVLKARGYPSEDVEAGREYVRSYVTFVHYVERAHEAASTPVVGHFPESHTPGRLHE
jgi:hypothetical protein